MASKPRTTPTIGTAKDTNVGALLDQNSVIQPRTLSGLLLGFCAGVFIIRQ